MNQTKKIVRWLCLRLVWVGATPLKCPLHFGLWLETLFVKCFQSAQTIIIHEYVMYLFATYFIDGIGIFIFKWWGEGEKKARAKLSL